MKRLYLPMAMAFTLLVTAAGNAAGTDDHGAMHSSTPSEKGNDMSEMKGAMHDKGMMPQGTMGHHMMPSGRTPITFVVYPGMMPMMQHNMSHGDASGDHRGGGMSQQEMVQRKEMMKNHMERMEQRLANIEAALDELIELQKSSQ